DSIVFSFGTEEKVEADNNIVVFDDGHYISQTHTDENGNFYSKSFYSDDINLVKSIMESWK
ncbi:MAG: hypothetical protein Q4D29_10205, partial [Lachnospiraceae bacterium]|nr:hypothetical protein [Lachnospiraceae bacterium]